jgi:CheY-like chemotaxis protein
MKKLLYVDDEMVNLRVFKALFRKKFDVLIAASASEALETLNQEGDIQLVISDLKMPLMNGIEFITKAKESFPNTNYFLLSGFYKNQEIQLALDQGLIQGYFEKPIDVSAILTGLKGVSVD